MAVKPEQNPSFIGSIQGEVAAEASPMLQFLLNHARLIFIGVALFLVAIAGYWVYSAQQDSRRAEQRAEFGRLATTQKGAALVTALEIYLRTAPEEMRTSAWIALAEAARGEKDYPRLYEAWKNIGALDPSLKVTAALAMSQALEHQAKKQEALAELETVAGALSGMDVMTVNSRIVVLAEGLGNFDRAVAAAEAITADPSLPADMEFWTYRVGVLQKKAQAAKQ